ncbi:WPE palindromic element domain-containing protein [Wolbachia endosymbiont of Drosophila aff. chauvacae BK-2020]|nr:MULTISPECIES: WPE palindromic element domain-containing protein [unclassified Wolbachia]MDU8909250.1 WPE palindromic element domain-containing protein [Wolbachia endosymbiont of Drosophila bocqueti]MDE5065558.1 WPE palindromic element domain-containing protein [Wolbachia endosymbiont of Drosophila seguyi]MDU8920932.1 WPE palindromic element domain-containing protein [Wolbachia endosymbiont of Scaptomyza pallida]MDU8922200.1 WPE palindromic element domain-containing protein [Wolbachia endosym
MSSQCSFLVIPVPRHWDPGNLTLHQVIRTGFQRHALE